MTRTSDARVRLFNDLKLKTRADECTTKVQSDKIRGAVVR